MKVDGKLIAQDLFDTLTTKVEQLKQTNILPHVVIILVGEDPASTAYVRQKELKAAVIGAKATIVKLPATISQEELLNTINTYNNDTHVHGLIVQRPLPKHIDTQAVNHAVDIKKDIDAFLPNSPYDMPLAGAVVHILRYILHHNKVTKSLEEWIKNHTIVVIGKGETGGGPTIELLKKLGANPYVIDSKTVNPDDLLKKADVIISTVGKQNIVKANNLKQGIILLGVGMSRGDDNKLHADYNEEEVDNIASFYTPVPGGVGPVNVAMLLKNLIQAAEIA